MTSLHDAALEWATAGASIVPTRTDGSKSPYGSWKQYQTTPATINQLNDWFTTGAFDGLGVITGAVSGNLEMLEVEARATHLLPDLVEQLTNCGHHDLWAAINQGCVESTPSGGIHWHYRVDGPAKPNTKLASKPNDDGTVNVLFETRGEGGFTILAPSNGRTHPTGRPWTRMGGDPSSIPTITVDQRDTLHGIIRSLFDQTPPIPAPRTNSHNPLVDGTRPGDDYNAKATWDDLLGRHGWTKTRPVGPSTGWVRPGKNPREGISATTRVTDTGDWLYVFTTSTVFTAETPYSKFSALALLEHGGDHSAAAATLRREGYGEDRPFPVAAPAPQLATAVATDTDGAAVATLTETSTEIHSGQLRIAKRLAATHHNKLLHVHGIGWHHYDGTRWVEDDTRLAGLAVWVTIRDAILESANGDKKLRTDATRCESAAGIKGTLDAAACLPEFAATVRDLDRDPYILNVANGTLDLHTLELRPHDPTDRLTKCTTAAYDPDAASTLWETFLTRVLPDEDVRGYLQRYVGAGLSGRVVEHALAILTGEGRNGKGVFYGAVRAALGDYAATADPDLFMHREGAHPTGEMDLRGLRWVVVSESDKNRRLAEATVKRLTGGDEIKARRMRQDFVAFDPSHTAALVTNHLPKVSGDDPALWARLRVIPFDIVIPEEERDVHLGERLSLEVDAVLTWLVAGLRQYQERGRLDEPAAVLRATDKYRIDSDAISGFLESRCIVNPHMRVAVADLWASWMVFCAEIGADETNQKAFGEALDRRGLTSRRGAGGQRFRFGLGLLSDEEDD